MALPVVIVPSGGYPMNRLSAHGGMPVTLAAQGLAVTEAPAGYGLPVTFVTEGGSVVLPVPPYATWNASDKDVDVTLSNGNLTATIASTVTGGVRATTGKSSGKYYFEVTMPTWGNPNSGPGIALATTPFPWPNTNITVAYVTKNGPININGAGVGTIGSSAGGEVISIAVDLDAKKIWFRKSPAGNWDNNVSHNPATGAGGFSIATNMSGVVFPAMDFVGPTAETAIANFGASAFVGAVPSGFTAGWPTT